MIRDRSDNADSSRSRSGIVLLVTLVLLVVLSTLGYVLSSRLGAQRRRCRYAVDYQAARYACDSAVKYALATLEGISPQLISRPNEPDFSDVFWLSEEQYRGLLAEAARAAAERAQAAYDANGVGDMNSIGDINSIGDANYLGDPTGDIYGINDVNDINDINDMNEINDIGYRDVNDTNLPVIRGPYGSPWPLVAKPAEFEIGSAKVKIEIHDENAKYPLGWMMLENKEVEREAVAGFETFCEWMDVNEVDIELVIEQLQQVAEIKTFKTEFKEISKREPIKESARGRSGSGRSARRSRRTQYKMKKVSVSEQVVEQCSEFAKLFHSSMLDTETLARPTIVTETRQESPLKYMAIWGSDKVNVNTAPRHVLEAAFAFGGDADKIAEEIIERRRFEPYKDIDGLKQALLQYSESIRKSESYITTASNYFTIRVTAVSGVAEASAVIAISKEGEITRRIAVISG